jgi:hypothetical protein
MTTKKTLRVPDSADGVPIALLPSQLDQTREVSAKEASAPWGGMVDCASPDSAAPDQVLEGEITVPVQSSIERTLTFEVLRRQSTEENEDKNEGNR